MSTQFCVLMPCVCRDQRRILVSFFVVFHLSFSDRVSHWTESLPLRLDWLTSKLQEPSSVCLPPLGLEVHAVMPMVHGCWWFKLISSYVHNFYPWRYHLNAQGTMFNHPLHCILRGLCFPSSQSSMSDVWQWGLDFTYLKSWWFSIFSLLNSFLISQSLFLIRNHNNRLF